MNKNYINLVVALIVSIGLMTSLQAMQNRSQRKGDFDRQAFIQRLLGRTNFAGESKTQPAYDHQSVNQCNPTCHQPTGPVSSSPKKLEEDFSQLSASDPSSPSKSPKISGGRKKTHTQRNQGRSVKAAERFDLMQNDFEDSLSSVDIVSMICKKLSTNILTDSNSVDANKSIDVIVKILNKEKDSDVFVQLLSIVESLDESYLNLF